MLTGIFIQFALLHETEVKKKKNSNLIEHNQALKLRMIYFCHNDSRDKDSLICKYTKNELIIVRKEK